MPTEQKIKKAFEVEFQEAINSKKFLSDSVFKADLYMFYEAGYLALLNSLNTLATYTDKNGMKHNISFTLPEGVTKP